MITMMKTRILVQVCFSRILCIEEDSRLFNAFFYGKPTSTTKEYIFYFTVFFVQLDYNGYKNTYTVCEFDNLLNV